MSVGQAEAADTERARKARFELPAARLSQTLSSILNACGTRKVETLLVALIHSRFSVHQCP